MIGLYGLVFGLAFRMFGCSLGFCVGLVEGLPFRILEFSLRFCIGQVSMFGLVQGLGYTVEARRVEYVEGHPA